MGEGFDFNARQYFDFNTSTNDPPDDDDSFFDSVTDVNGMNAKVIENVTERENSDPESDAYLSPVTPKITAATMSLKSQMRRSLSVGQLPTRSRHASESSSTNEYRRPVSAMGRTPSKDAINRLSKPKRYGSHDNLTLAEAVVKFQRGTPKRFHSKASPKKKQPCLPLHVTKAFSPKLKTSGRSRPVLALSKEEREQKEYEEVKKFKIKSHPVSQKVLKGPIKAHVEVKPTTVVEPFNLTRVAKKTELPEEKKIIFKAHPVPKSLNKPFKTHPSVQEATKAQSPNITKLTKNPYQPVKTEKQENLVVHPVKPSATEVKPFSFEIRDQLLMKRKEQFVNKVLEEEKKAREFHARPIPKAVLRQKSCNEEQKVPSAKARSRSSEELVSAHFKARPAVVLMTKPFEPKKDPNHCLKVEAFQFNTDNRLEARHRFEALLKAKDAAAEAAKKASEEEARRLELEEVARLRKQMEHKAQPIKKYKEIKIELNHKITTPISPKFHTDKIRNKENVEH